MYSIDDHGDMLADGIRMRAYAAALRATVRPGCVVLDVGAGTGVLGLLACRFGAARVHAVEPSPIVQVAREIAADNGLAGRIIFHETSARDLQLSEKVDLIVSDLHGTTPFYQQGLRAVIDLRRRLLAPGGRVIPLSDRLWLALVEAPELFRQVAVPWRFNDLGLELRAGAAVAANRRARAPVSSAQLMSSPMPCGEVFYEHVEAADWNTEVELEVSRPGTAHGLCLWFDSELTEGIGFSNAPGNPDLVYGRSFFRWPEAVELQRGDRVRVRLAATLVGEDYVWTWDSVIHAGSAHANPTRFRQSTFLGEPMSPATFKLIDADRAPPLRPAAQVDRDILARMDAGTRLRDIAAQVAAAFPRYFESGEEALCHVRELSLRYGARDENNA